MKLVLLCAFVFEIAHAQGNMPLLTESIGICTSTKDVVLQSRGEAASQIVMLDGGTKNNGTFCEIKVTAPKSHVVNFQFMEEINETRRNDTNDMVSKEKRPSCVMSIYLPDNSTAPFWKGDPCSGEKMADIDLLTSEFNIRWIPPENQTTIVVDRTIVLTAVGSGPSCKEPFQHTCMRIGRIPMLCISDHLLCDGLPNCPKTSTNSDEDPKMCSVAKNAWENFVVELVKKYRPQSDTDDNYADLQGNSSDVPSDSQWFVQWQLVKKNVTDKPNVVNETHSASESISAMLNKYGPWGYLMMGLLICGTVLFFCGLWECCCKRPKPEVDAPPLTNNPTTILVMNCDQGAPPMPPQYDDLDDLPPSYTTLFPAEEGRYTSLSEEGMPSTSNEDDEKSEDIHHHQGTSSESEPVTVQERVQINHISDLIISASQEELVEDVQEEREDELESVASDSS